MIDALDAMDEGDEDLLALVIAEFETNKARERRFGSRSEAGRYAAQIRWGNRGGEGSGAGLPPLGVPMEPTWDIGEALTTGRPYAPLMEENFPDDLKELQRQVSALDEDQVYYRRGVVKQFHDRLTEHYRTVIHDGLQHPESAKGEFASKLKRSGKNVQGLASEMASAHLGKVADRVVLKRLGEDRAMKITSGFIDGDRRKRITVSAHEDDAITILADGRVKTQFETNKSRGTLDPTIRAAHEAIAYGTHPLTRGDVRPVYGSLQPYGVRNGASLGIRQYGSVHFVMKNAVVDRSTASLGDSLLSYTQANPARKAITPQVHSNMRKPASDPRSPEKIAQEIKRGESHRYVEAQIHGGVKVSDIAYIAVDGDVSPRLQKAAAKAGLQIRQTPTVVERDNRTLFPSLDDADVAKALDAMDKARERRFSSRSEAGRYAAQVRWGNRGASVSGGKPSTGLVMEPTNDVAEAIATGRPYAPLLEENFPDDLKAMQAEVSKLESVDIIATMSDRPEIVSRYQERLREHYETVLADGLEQVRGDKPPSVMVQKALSNDPGFSRIMAKNMADEQMRRDAQRAYIRDKIGEQRAMEFTAAAIDGSPRKRITVSAYEDDALRILSDGRVKTQFETATSNGMLSVQTRASHEAIAYGVHPFTNPQVRPVYGALHPYGVRHAEQNRSEQYGRVHFVMKDAVIDRSTASVEDSLGTVLQPNPARKAVQPQYSSKGLIPKELAGSPEDVATRHREGRSSPYAEAQIHGGVKLGDIAYIAISEPPKASRELRAAARSRGLEIKVLPQGDGRSFGAQEFPALDDSAMEKSASLDMVGLLTDAIQKARERKFNSRSEAGRYAAQIRWGNRGATGGGDDRVAALKAEAMAIRSELAVLAEKVDLSQVPIGNPETGENWHDGPDSPPIIIDSRTGELVPSPRLCDLHDRLIVVGDELHQRSKARTGDTEGMRPDEVYGKQAAAMQAEVGAVRQLGETATIGRSAFIAGYRDDEQMGERAVKAVEEAGRVMPSDWVQGTNLMRFDLIGVEGEVNAFYNPGMNSMRLPDPRLISPGMFAGSSTLSGLAAHELTHVVEFTRPGVRLAEVAFMAHRTHGFKTPPQTASLRTRVKSGATETRQTGQLSGGTVVELMPDRFKNLYSGRLYASNRPGSTNRVSSFYETLSTGMESYFGGNRQKLDDDHMAFVLGTLVSA